MTSMTPKVFFRKVFSKVAQKTAVKKTFEAWAAKGYSHTPRVSFVIQTFNKSAQVCDILPILRTFPDSEIIVLDDGGKPEHTQRFLDNLKGANEFLIRSNDLYEVITYDRAITFARGEFVALLQDDDGIHNIDWIVEAISLFEKHPRLAVLGGRGGQEVLPRTVVADQPYGEFVTVDGVSQSENLFRLRYQHSSHLSAGTSILFIPAVNRAPMWIRRSAYLTTLGPIDMNYAPVQQDDVEICLRAWTRGWQVGLYRAGFELGEGGEGGMRIWNSEILTHQEHVNWNRVYQTYESKFAEIGKAVDEANASSSVSVAK